MLPQREQPPHESKRGVRVTRGDELLHLVERREVARLSSGLQLAADAGQVEGDVADEHQPAARRRVVVVAHRKSPNKYCASTHTSTVKLAVPKRSIRI